MSAAPAAVVDVVAPFVQGVADAHALCGGTLPGAAYPWLAAQRRGHVEALLAGGLPQGREERWKYTPLRGLARGRFQPATPAHAHAALDHGWLDASGLGGPRLVFVNGHFRADLSLLQGLPPGLELQPLSQGPELATDTDLCVDEGADAEQASWRRIFAQQPSSDPADAFLQVNAALAADGVLLRVPAGTAVHTPVELVFAGAAADARDDANDATPLLWNLRNLVELGAGASLTLLERHLGSAGPAQLGTCHTRVVLGVGAKLQHVRLQQSEASTQLIAHSEVQVGAGAVYAPLSLEFGGALSRHEWRIALTGQRAETRVRGLVLGNGRQQVDTRLTITHAVPATRSETLWRAIADQRSRAAFHGGITIAEGADGSDAALQTRNLLLSDAAEIDAQPVLEIHADEVKASHGAAIGQLDAGALFYLRARGIPEARARHMLIDAFCAAVLEHGRAPVDAAQAEAGPASETLAAVLREAVHSRLLQLEGSG